MAYSGLSTQSLNPPHRVRRIDLDGLGRENAQRSVLPKQLVSIVVDVTVRVVVIVLNFFLNCCRAAASPRITRMA